MPKYKQKQINELIQLIEWKYTIDEKKEIAHLLMDLAYIYLNSNFITNESKMINLL